MEVYYDNDGLGYTASRPESINKFSTLVECYMGHRPETGRVLKELLTADAEMPMGMCIKGYFSKTMGSTVHHQRAVNLLGKLKNFIRETEITRRERWHIDALEAWCTGDLTEAVKIWEKILLHHPQDSIALRLAYFNYFYSGDGESMRDVICNALQYWESSHPLYGYLLGMYAFGLEESGNLPEANEFGRKAVEINPQDAWAVHSVAHVMETQGQYKEGIKWLADLEPQWSTTNNFRFHLYWHQCLFHIERGEYDQALDIHDRLLVSDLDSEFYLDLCNAASVLWRLELHGINVGDRWHVLAEAAKRHIFDQDLLFVSLHYLMPLAAIGDREATDSLMQNLLAWQGLEETQSGVIEQVGLPLAKTICEIRQGKPGKAYENLCNIRSKLKIIGGSHAQRDLFTMILLDATCKAGYQLEAEELFAKRIADRRKSAWSWRQYGQLLQLNGKPTEATQAFEFAANPMKVPPLASA